MEKKELLPDTPKVSLEMLTRRSEMFLVIGNWEISLQAYTVIVTTGEMVNVGLMGSEDTGPQIQSSRSGCLPPTQQWLLQLHIEPTLLAAERIQVRIFYFRLKSRICKERRGEQESR